MLLPCRSDCYTDTFLGVVCDFQLLIIFLLSADYKMQFKALNHLDSSMIAILFAVRPKN